MMTLLRALQRSSLFALCALLLISLWACSSEQPSPSPVPQNALEAATAWPGKRVLFYDSEGNTTFKLRQRASSLKLFSDSLTPLAYARNIQGNVTVYPRDASSDAKDTQTTDPQQLQLSAVDNPPKNIVQRLALRQGTQPPLFHIDRLPINSSPCQMWRISKPDGTLVATLTPRPLEGTESCTSTDTSWVLLDAKQGAFTSGVANINATRNIMLVKGQDSKAFAPNSEEDPQDAILRAETTKMSTIIPAIAHIQGLEPTHKLALMVYLMDHTNPASTPSDEATPQKPTDP